MYTCMNVKLFCFTLWKTNYYPTQRLTSIPNLLYLLNRILTKCFLVFQFRFQVWHLFSGKIHLCRAEMPMFRIIFFTWGGTTASAFTKFADGLNNSNEQFENELYKVRSKNFVTKIYIYFFYKNLKCIVIQINVNGK